MKGINPESRKLSLWNPKFTTLESEIQPLESRNPLTKYKGNVSKTLEIRIWNRATFQPFNPESEDMANPESNEGSLGLPYMKLFYLKPLQESR